MLPNIIFTLISLINAGLTLLVTLPLIIIMINHLRRNRDVVLLLMTNSYITMFAFSIVVFVININVLQADLYGSINVSTSDSSECHFQGFLQYATIGCCYMSFVLQASYRLTRVIYAKRKIFQSFTFNFICIVIQWMLGFLIQLPIYVWPKPIYALYKMNYYCGIPYENTWSTLYAVLNMFVNPVVLLSIIYARLLYFIRHQSPQISQTQQGKKAERDFIITRRILFIVNTLTLPGLPNAIFYIMTTIDRRIAGAYYMYRIQWMGAMVIIFMMSIALVIMTPQVKVLVTNEITHRENRVVPKGKTRNDHQTISLQRTQTMKEQQIRATPMAQNRF